MTNGVLECYRCRTPVPQDSRYCSSCGADVSGGGAPPTTSNIDLLQQRLQRLIAYWERAAWGPCSWRTT